MKSPLKATAKTRASTPTAQAKPKLAHRAALDALLTAPMSQPLLAQELASQGFAEIDVESVALTGSTNDDLLERARSSRPLRPVLRAAHRQSAGRGRQGRRWSSEPGASLLFSLAYPLQRMPPALPAVTLVCGVALAHSMRAAGVPVLLKWPNDVLLEGAKLAGVLSELAIDRTQGATLIVGVGVNLRIDADARREFDRPVAALADARKPLVAIEAREAWTARLAAALLGAIREFEQGGFAPWVERFDALFAYRNQSVELQSAHAPSMRGVALGVDPMGQLLIEDDDGLKAISAGEVSLRVKP